MTYNKMLDVFENEIDNEVKRITNILIDISENYRLFTPFNSSLIPFTTKIKYLKI